MKHDSPHRPSPALPFLLGEADEERSESDGRVSVEPGALVGDYRLVTRLAVGGMAEVWLADAVHGKLAGRTLAIKRLLPALRGDEATVARFRAEALLGTALHHPNLARTHELHERPPELFLVQELVGGETLGLLAAAARKAGKRLSITATLHAVEGLLAGLRYLHEGGAAPSGQKICLVHADVNPDNVVACLDGSVKLIDLGLAQRLHDDGTASSPDGALRGTPAYMSPEQVKSRPLDPRSDLFSVGVLLWELLANRPLFAAETEWDTLCRVRELAAPPLRAVFPEAPTVLERILVRALAKDPAQRFQSAAEMGEALHQAAQRERLPAGADALAAEVARLAPRAPKAE